MTAKHIETELDQIERLLAQAEVVATTGKRAKGQAMREEALERVMQAHERLRALTLRAADLGNAARAALGDTPNDAI